MNRNELVSSILKNIQNGVFVEIGTHKGEFADHILSCSTNSKLYCIDPYLSYSSYEDAINNTTGNDIFNNTSKRLKEKYGNRIIFIRNFSENAVDNIPDNIDFLYIDGNHQYEYVYNDLKLYYPKVKDGCYIIGDDAVDMDENRRNKDGNVSIAWNSICYGTYGVVKAFRNFCKENSIDGKIEGTQYVIQKKMRNKDILFVSAFKDIGRTNWNSEFCRTTESYIELFGNLIQHIKYELIVFLEPNILKQVQSRYGELLKTLNNIVFLNLQDVNTFFNKYLEQERKVMYSSVYQEKVKSNNKIPEHWCPEYNLVNHSKINFVNRAKKLYPNYTYYSWLDFGSIRNVDNVPRNMDLTKLSKHITYLALEKEIKNVDANYMLTKNEVYLAGSQYIVHTDLVEKFEEIYEQQLVEWYKNFICDDDQNLVLQLYLKYSELFCLKYSNTWFSLFHEFYNT